MLNERLVGAALLVVACGARGELQTDEQLTNVGQAGQPGTSGTGNAGSSGARSNPEVAWIEANVSLGDFQRNNFPGPLSFWGAAPGDVWGAASAGDRSGSSGFIWHWDGTVWSYSTSSLSSLLTVWGTSSKNVYMGGAGILHWGGSNWSPWTATASSLPKLEALDASVISGVSASDIWFVSNHHDTVSHWDGVGFQNYALGYISDLWSISHDDAWAVGPDGLALHFTDSWTPVQTSLVGLKAVWGVSHDDVWAVGDAGTIAHYAGQGTGWTTIDDQGRAYGSETRSNLTDVWGRASNDVWAVGGQGTILHWDGLRWLPMASHTTAELWSIWGNAEDVWIGAVGVILRGR